MGNKVNNNWYALRWRMLRRDNFTCQYCGQSAPSVILHVDHKVSKANGGNDEEDNLITACSACNVGKNLSSLRVPLSKGDERKKKNAYEQAREYLLVNEEATATEISKAINRAKSRCNIAHMLANSGDFMVTRREGQRVYYGMVRAGETGKV